MKIPIQEMSLNTAVTLYFVVVVVLGPKVINLQAMENSSVTYLSNYINPSV